MATTPEKSPPFAQEAPLAETEAPAAGGARKRAPARSAAKTAAQAAGQSVKGAKAKWIRPLASSPKRGGPIASGAAPGAHDEWVKAATEPAAEAPMKVTPGKAAPAKSGAIKGAAKTKGPDTASPAGQGAATTPRRKSVKIAAPAEKAAAEVPQKIEAKFEEPAKPDAPPQPQAKAEPKSMPEPPAKPEPAPMGAEAAFGLRYPLPHFETLANNVARAFEQMGRVFAAYMRPRESGEIKASAADDVGEMARALAHVAEYYMSEPRRALEAQTALTTQFINLWAETLKRLQGAPAEPVAEPEKSDKRFSDAEWRDNPFFDFMKQAYVLTARWADDLVQRADEMEPRRRDKALFYLRQVTAALSPSNFVGTNPELLRATFEESGENIVRGLKMLAEDIEAGKGSLRIRQSDAKAFKLGVNLATTPGKVVFRNDLIELIQYEPTTEQVFKRPLLIIPPWINKFYILDLNAEKSFIRWAVAQGLTVFVVSWVNPDERHADKGFEAYMHEGIFAALGAIEEATGEKEIAAIGYCVGGTLLGATLGYMAATGDKRIVSATFFTTQIDFTDAGDLKVFVDAEQLKALEERMQEKGYLEGSAMANAFNMLRPNDLIWSYYVNNYLKGKEPMPFDLLVWNADSTRMPAANHKFYLRHCYFQNDLSTGRMEFGGVRLDLKKVTIPVYELAAKEDHIAPARSVFTGAKCFGGPVRYVMAGSGHIAGVVNPPTKPKYQYWSDGAPAGDFKDWVAGATETPGSWWPDWAAWISEQAPGKVAARKPGGGKLKPLADAPGDYVRMKS